MQLTELQLKFPDLTRVDCWWSWRSISHWCSCCSWCHRWLRCDWQLAVVRIMSTCHREGNIIHRCLRCMSLTISHILENNLKIKPVLFILRCFISNWCYTEFKPWNYVSDTYTVKKTTSYLALNCGRKGDFCSVPEEALCHSLVPKYIVIISIT